MRFTPLPLRTRVRAPVAGVAAAVSLLFSSPALLPQEPSPDAERDTLERPEASLVVDHPIYLPVRPPAAYREAVRRGTRSESGRPGPEYWQQEVDYDLDVELVPSEALLRGRGTVTYTNRSPHALNGVVVRLYQNVFRAGVPRNRAVEPTGGVELARVEVGGRGLEELAEEDVREAAARGGRPPAGYLVEGTLAQVILPEPLAPGATAEFGFEWSFRVPGEDAFRMGHIDRRVFNVAQWYPQLATLDDVQGLDTTPYLGDGEFYLEYGSFSVDVTVPEGWTVAATGELVNAEERLPVEARNRLAAALGSDTVVRVLEPGDRPETFDRAYRAYAEAWAYRHPYPWDFFRIMEAESGRDLDWFWQPWFYETHTLDQAVEAVEPAADGVRITVRNLEDAVMPVILEVELEDGTTRRVTWPAEVWAGTREVTGVVGLDGAPAGDGGNAAGTDATGATGRGGGEADGDAASTAIVRVTIDPEVRFPDVDRENNRWPRESR